MKKPRAEDVAIFVMAFALAYIVVSLVKGYGHDPQGDDIEIYDETPR